MIAGQKRIAEAPSASARADVLTAVVVAHNSRATLEPCLAALAAERTATVVVDAGSADDGPAFVQARFPQARLISCSNVGFGRACNIGVQACSSPFVLLLNADSWPLAGAVAELLAALEHDPVAGLTGPCLLDRSGRQQRSIIGQPIGAVDLLCWTLAPRATRVVYLGLRRIQRRASSRVVDGRDFLVGAALLVRRQAFEDAGGFDDSFFMFNEDADLCYRLRRAGWTTRYIPEARFVHLGGASTSAVAAAMARERLRSHVRLIAKHRGSRRAETARTCLAYALRARSVVRRGSAARLDRELGDWLARTPTPLLLGRDRSPAP